MSWHQLIARLCFVPAPVASGKPAIMRRLDPLQFDHPFADSRMLYDLLRREGVSISQALVATLMRRMGIKAAVDRAPGRRPSTADRETTRQSSGLRRKT